MTTGERETITLAEFNQRLDASNARRQQELDQREEEQARVELLLTQYECALDAIEAEQHLRYEADGTLQAITPAGQRYNDAAAPVA